MQCNNFLLLCTNVWYADKNTRKTGKYGYIPGASMLRRYFGKISPLQIGNLVGHNGELVIDELNDTIYIMDGVTPGGHRIVIDGINTNQPANPNPGSMWYDDQSGRMYIYYGNTWVDANPSLKGDTGPTGPAGGPTGPVGPTGPARGPTGAIGPTGASAQNNRISNGNLQVTLDSSGTLNTPLLLPRIFTAILDTVHCTSNPGGTFTSEPWYYEVHFVCTQGGIVETQIDGNRVWNMLPNYPDGSTFDFTEADHGIPNYTLTIIVVRTINTGPSGWAAEIAVTQGPQYPSTIRSLGAIKITTNANSWTFGTNGILTSPPGSDIRDAMSNISVLKTRIGDTYASGAFQQLTIAHDEGKLITVSGGIGVFRLPRLYASLLGAEFEFYFSGDAGQIHIQSFYTGVRETTDVFRGSIFVGTDNATTGKLHKATAITETACDLFLGQHHAKAGSYIKVKAVAFGTVGTWLFQGICIGDTGQTPNSSDHPFQDYN
jgi:hypothetical protein